MPGVNITTSVRTGPVGAGDIVAGQFFVVGETERGPVDGPTLLRSFADYVTYYGDYQSENLYAHVKTYFDEGGTRCYVQRVAGVGASAGSLTLLDAADAASMVMTAKTAGAWSENLKVEVVDGDNAGYRVKFYLNDALIYTSRDLASIADGVATLNASSVNHLVEVASANASNDYPANLVPTPISGGADGPTVTTDQIVDALDLFTANLNSGAVAAPGRSGSTVWNGLRDHAAANNRVALCGFASGASQATVKAEAADYAADASANHMAFYYPHVKVDSPSVDELAAGTSAITSSTLTISPEAYVAAARTKAVQAAGGPWRAGAGAISSAATLRGLEVDLTPAQANLLDAARVNAIKTVSGQIRVYGARSASNDEANWRFITLRDTLNYIVYGVEERMEQFVFETIDGRGNLFGNMRASIKAFLEPIRLAGGLYEAYDEDGKLVDPGFSVVVDSTNNPTTQLATGLVKAQVGVRVSSVADQIQITIAKSNLTAPVI